MAVFFDAHNTGWIPHDVDALINSPDIIVKGEFGW
jgi:hypothetical protein